MISKKLLLKEYQLDKKSVHEIASKLGCSDNKVTYWLNKHGIEKRSISEAVYIKANPKGDPFCFTKPVTDKEWFLYGLGVGLFWGEGNKVNTHSVRLGNTDPSLIKVFLQFLVDLYHIDTSKLRFGLQIFSDTSPHEAKLFWINTLMVKEQQFQKIVITKSGKVGTYTRKNKHGVLTIYFSNKKLRDSIVSAIEALQRTSYANVAQSVERIHGKS